MFLISIGILWQDLKMIVSYFPEPMWGTKQRVGTYKLERFEEFLEGMREILPTSQPENSK